MYVHFYPVPGDEYILWWDDEYGSNNNAHLWPTNIVERQYRYTSADVQPGQSVITAFGDRSFLSFILKATWYVIRVGKEEWVVASDGGFVFSAVRNVAKGKIFVYKKNLSSEEQSVIPDKVTAATDFLRAHYCPVANN